MHFSKFGYEYTKEGNNECFDNLMLVYDGGDLYWITCSNRVLNKVDKYFESSEIFVMGFSLKKREGYNMHFISNIKYKDVLDDIKDNGLKKKIEINFTEREYNKYTNFKILAKSFDEIVTQLTGHLSTLHVDTI